MKGFKTMLKSMVLAVTAAALLSGCSILKRNSAADPADARAYESIQDALMNLQTYRAQASVKYISNKGENTYTTIQNCKSTGEYRIEVIGPEAAAGNVTLFDGKTIYQYNANIPGKIAVGTTDTQERSEIFLTSFIRNYLSSAEVSVSVANLDEGKATVLEANVPGDHPYLSTEKLWVDNETYLPVQLVIYDSGGAERIVITYEKFEFNPELDNNLFTMPEVQNTQSE